MRSSASDSSTVAHNTTKCAAPVNGTYMQRFMYAWHDIARCFEMVRREEANRGSAYDFVIKMRPDAQLCKPFPAWTALNLSNHKTEAHSMDKYSRTIATYGKVAADGPEAHDHVAIMARPLADRYFAAEQEIADCAPHSEYGRSSCHGFPHSGWRQKSDVPAECLLSRWLQRGGVAWDTYDHPIMGMSNHCLWNSDKILHRCTGGCKPGAARLAQSAAAG